MRRLVLATSFAFLAFGAPAEAALVSLDAAPRKVRFEAAPGEVNRLSVTQVGTVVTFEDAGATLTVPSGQSACVLDAPNKATCTTPTDLFRVQAELEDGDDEAVAHGPWTMKLDGGDGNDVLTGDEGADDLDGGEGNDTIEGRGGADDIDAGGGDDVIRAREGVRDTVICGLGQDTGEADLEDEVAADCEAVVKPLLPPGADTSAGAPGADAGAPVDPAIAALPAPVAGKKVSVGVKSGTVRVTLPGAVASSQVVAGRSLPVGATVDTRKGVVTLVSAKDTAGTAQAADFSGGVFTVGQKRSARMNTVLRLRGGNFGACPRVARASVARAAGGSGTKPVRRLWGSGHGRFSTRGRNAAATVRGTVWTVTDRCDGTMTRVKRGAVAVRNLRTKRTKLVRAGQQHFVRSSR